METKNLFKLLTFLLVALMSVSLTSCGDDDDDEDGPSGSNGKLVGLWEPCSMTMEYQGESETIELQQELIYELGRVQFNADGTAVSYEYNYNTESWYADDVEDVTTWAFDGSTLTITETFTDSDKTEETKVAITSISSDSFTMKMDKSLGIRDMPEGVVGYLTYKKI